MIFVDTGAWFAVAVPSDPDHDDASRWLADNTEPLLTTDYIVDETLTLLRARGERRRALLLGEAFFAEQLADVYRLTEADIASAWEVFRRFDDKGWSFTDCTSKVVIERLNILQAFAFDQHFRQFGSARVVP
ncbi:MAG: type II toxin-antitoxin system VapC family toxin [Acidobacteria bacterium]|nr:type II toxin-antitoxin system VapC family toxin [Acidobacteriota bacterium]